MNHRITCYTLFDITVTGVLNRARPADDVTNIPEWVYQRNTQSNFDTLMQVISLRSLPELLTTPKKEFIKFDGESKFGFLYVNDSDEKYPCWAFDFEIHSISVFEDGISELGHLYRDCEQIPMIKCGTEYNKLGNFLDTSPELRNVYFVKY